MEAIVSGVHIEGHVPGVKQRGHTVGEASVRLGEHGDRRVALGLQSNEGDLT